MFVQLPLQLVLGLWTSLDDEAGPVRLPPRELSKARLQPAPQPVSSAAGISVAQVLLPVLSLERALQSTAHAKLL